MGFRGEQLELGNPIKDWVQVALFIGAMSFWVNNLFLYYQDCDQSNKKNGTLLIKCRVAINNVPFG